ncbi:MAG: DUF58 domain-containing protein [Chitinophagales bacterium]
METSELIKKVRKIEIKTKGLTNQVFAGSYHSAFKGRGMSFSEVRNYNYGDDVRNIDWNVTARYDEPFIKVYEEERELTVMLLIDVSKSSFFGTQSQFKNEYITEIAAILAFSAIRNNDKVGVIFFSNKIEKYIPAKKGKSHILRIIRELIEVKPTENGTNIALAMKYFNNTMKRSSIAFIISDFMDKPENYSDGLSIAKKKHDVIGLHIYDEREKKLSDSGLMQFVDSETGKAIWIDTSNKQVQEEYNKHFEECFEATKKGFHKKGADLLSISTSDNYTIALKQMFNRRIQKK